MTKQRGVRARVKASALDPARPLTRTQITEQLRSDGDIAFYQRSEPVGPLIVAVLLLVLPFEASTVARVLAASAAAATVPVDRWCRRRIAAEWSHMILLVFRVAVASLIAFVIPALWHAAAVLLTAFVVRAVGAEPRRWVVALGATAAASLTSIALVHGVDRWYLVMAAFVIGPTAHSLWHRDWLTEHLEVDRRHDEMLDRSPVFSWEVDVRTGTIISIVGNVEAILGWPADELVGMDVGVLVDTDVERQILRDELSSHTEYERHSVVTARHRDGHAVTLREVRLVSRSADILRGVSFDISELSAATEALRHQAERDALTGLTNRVVLQDAVTRALAEPSSTVVLLLADLDRFKLVNDTLGHPVGDRLLQVLADRLADGLEDLDVVARMGGDEFAFCAVGATSSEQVAVLAERVHRLITGVVAVDDLQLAVSGSVGVACSPLHGTTYADLLRHADIATYEAKRRGGGWHIFETSPDDLSVRRLRLASEIPAALDNGEFEMHFQPQIDLGTGEIAGAEGLARWRHPELGLLEPEDFFSAVEVSSEHGRFEVEMVRQATLLATALERAGRDDLRVSFNLSARALLDRSLPSQIADLLSEHRLPPSRLTVEVEESALLDEHDAWVAVMAGLVDLGLRLSIDDLGTGYTSVRRLRDLDADEVKIDRRFVQGLGEATEDAISVSHVVRLAHHRGIELVAEGVQSVEQMQWLQRTGCSIAQGFLWSPAVPSDELLAFVADEVTFDIGEGTEPGGGLIVDAVIRGSMSDAIADRDVCRAVDQLMHRLEPEVDHSAVFVMDLGGRIVRGNDRFRRGVGEELYQSLLGRCAEDFASGANSGTFAGDGFSLRGFDPKSHEPALFESAGQSRRVYPSVVDLRDLRSRLVGSVSVVTAEPAVSPEVPDDQ